MLLLDPAAPPPDPLLEPALSPLVPGFGLYEPYPAPAYGEAAAFEAPPPPPAVGAVSSLAPPPPPATQNFPGDPGPG